MIPGVRLALRSLSGIALAIGLMILVIGCYCLWEFATYEGSDTVSAIIDGPIGLGATAIGLTVSILSFNRFQAFRPPALPGPGGAYRDDSA